MVTNTHKHPQTDTNENDTTFAAQVVNLIKSCDYDRICCCLSTLQLQSSDNSKLAFSIADKTDSIVISQGRFSYLRLVNFFSWSISFSWRCISAVLCDSCEQKRQTTIVKSMARKEITQRFYCCTMSSHYQGLLVSSYLLVAWHSGRTSVFHPRTFPVLRSTCSWRVTTYLGKPSAVGQPTRPTQPFILSG